MDNFKFTLIGILLFAISTSIVYVWGLKKSMKQTATLKEMLLTQDLVSDIKASEFYSKKTVVVQNEIEFTNTLISFMLDKNLIIKEKNTYCRSK